MEQQTTTIGNNLDPFSSWWPYIIASVVALVITIRNTMAGQKCPTSNNLNERTVIITGGNSGIGLEMCKELYYRSAKIIIACRDTKRTEKCIKSIKRRRPSHLKDTNLPEIDIRYLDLESFNKIREFATLISKDYKKIDILINNAGIALNPYQKTADDFESQLQVNYLGPFLLTYCLLPMLKKSKDGRIINVSAHAHMAAKMNFDDPLNLKASASDFQARDSFAHSKLAITLFTRQLPRYLEEKHDKHSITVNCFTPGLVRGTGHFKRSPIMSSISVKMMTYPWMWLFMKSPAQGAQCGIYLATDANLKTISGKYFNDCEQVLPSELAQDDKLAEKLFEETLQVLKLA